MDDEIYMHTQYLKWLKYVQNFLQGKKKIYVYTKVMVVDLCKANFVPRIIPNVHKADLTDYFQSRV